MGALTRGRARRGRRGRRRRRRLDGARSPSAAPRVHVKLDTGMGRLGTKDRELALRLAAARRTSVGLMTHFATADEPGDELFGAQLDAFRRFVDDGRAATTCSSTPPTAPRRCATRPAHFDMVRCGVAIYGMDPFRRGPRRPRARARAVAATPGSAAVKPLRAGRVRRLRPALDGAGADLGRDGPDRLRRRLAARAHQQLRRADPRPPAPAGRHGQHGQHHGRARRRHRRGGRRRGRADRRAGGGADPGRGGGAAARHDQLRGHLRRSRRGCRRRARAGEPAAWIVGGALRDELLGRPVRDVDVAVAGDPARPRAGAGARGRAARSSGSPRRSAPGA